MKAMREWDGLRAPWRSGHGVAMGRLRLVEEFADAPARAVSAEQLKSELCIGDVAADRLW